MSEVIWLVIGGQAAGGLGCGSAGSGAGGSTDRVAYRPGWFGAGDLDGFPGATQRIGLWLDTPAQTAGETVADIFWRRGRGAR